MFERLLAAVESIAASLLSIAASLKDAAIRGGGAPAAEPAKAPAAPAAAVPAALAALAAPAAVPPAGPTKEEVQTKAREFSDKHGRDEAKKVMAAVGLKNIKEIKPEQIQPFFNALAAADAAKAGGGDDDLGL